MVPVDEKRNTLEDNEDRTKGCVCFISHSLFHSFTIPYKMDRILTAAMFLLHHQSSKLKFCDNVNVSDSLHL